MADAISSELRRRSLVKSLVWRLVGIVWTWVGAYIILLCVPPSRQTAGFIATLIVVYHHSTRMIMYYLYERLWASIAWGRATPSPPMTRKECALWTMGTALALVVIFYLLLEVTPSRKKVLPEDARPSDSSTTEILRKGRDRIDISRTAD